MVITRLALSSWAVRISKVLSLPVVRLLGQAAVKGLWLPSTASWPTFIPDLGRFTRSAAFRDRQVTASTWINRHFSLIEQGAPWLDRAGAEVRDYCTAGAGNRFTAGWVAGHTFPATPSVGCYRHMAVVYGFDGALGARLPELANALLFMAGWGEQSEHFWQAGRWTHAKVAIQRLPEAGGRRNASWDPVPALERPADMEIVPWNPRNREHLPHLVIAWASHRGPGIPDGLSAGYFGPVRDDLAANPRYQPVDISDEDIGALQARALAAPGAPQNHTAPPRRGRAAAAQPEPIVSVAVLDVP